jgi:predicted RNase H-like HicB family nuclease
MGGMERRRFHLYRQCPDLITGIHGDDPVKLFAKLEQTLEDVIAHFKEENRPLPTPRTRPMQEVA